MNKVVVDASIAVKWIVKEPDSDVAWALLTSWIAQNVRVMAPILLASEVTNILHRASQKGELPFHRIARDLETTLFPNIFFDFANIRTFHFFAHAAKFAHDFKLSAAYDAHYLALAEREGCELWTADKRLYNSVREQLSWVHLMA